MAWLRKKKVEEAPVVAKVESVSVPTSTPAQSVKVEGTDRYSLTTIATQTSEVILDKATDETIDVQSALILILNKLDKIEEVLLN